MLIMLFSIEQSILTEETLANLWSFAKFANVPPKFPSIQYKVIDQK